MKVRHVHSVFVNVILLSPYTYSLNIIILVNVLLLTHTLVLIVTTHLYDYEIGCYAGAKK